LGKTFISAGYNEEDEIGFDSVYIAIPNSDNTNATIKEIIHTGNFKSIFTKAHLEDVLRHDFERSEDGTYPSSNSERALRFLDKTGNATLDCLGAVRSV
jgi:hypothetical protein